MIELDIETGELLFEWSSLDHVTPDGKSFFRQPSQVVYFTHSQQRPYFLSIQARLVRATTHPTLGTTSTSTPSTRTKLVTISSQPVMLVLYTRLTGLLGRSSGAWAAFVQILIWVPMSLSAFNIMPDTSPRMATRKSFRSSITPPTAPKTIVAMKFTRTLSRRAKSSQSIRPLGRHPLFRHSNHQTVFWPSPKVAPKFFQLEELLSIGDRRVL